MCNKDVLLRVDINVPVHRGKVTDTSRIIAIAPTVNYIIKKGGRPIILSHFGRPNGPNDKFFSLRVVLSSLKRALDREVAFCDALDPSLITAFIKKVPKKTVILLENTRFFDGELCNSSDLGTVFSELGDLYCNDAFSASHRAHASIVSLAEKLPSYSGLLLEKEVTALTHALSRSNKPVVALIGGSKISTKISLLKNLIQKVDHIIICGGMANTFLFAQKKQVGCSMLEKNLTHLALEILYESQKSDCQIHLPVDAVCAFGLKENSQATIFDIDFCPNDQMILDIGPKSITRINNILNQNKTLIWNGPLGAFETSPFDKSTISIAMKVANLTSSKNILSVAGGGDTVAALKRAKVSDKLTYVSNAGGAFLEWMEGKNLPGLAALSNEVKV